MIYDVYQTTSKVEGKSIIVYGICYHGDSHVVVLPPLCENFKAVAELADDMTDGNLAMNHVADVLEDWVLESTL